MSPVILFRDWIAKRLLRLIVAGVGVGCEDRWDTRVERGYFNASKDPFVVASWLRWLTTLHLTGYGKISGENVDRATRWNQDDLKVEVPVKVVVWTAS